MSNLGEGNDIILVKLARQSKGPLQVLNFASNVPTFGYRLEACGFGRTTNTDLDSISNNLLKAYLDSLDDMTCAAGAEENIICAGSDADTQAVCIGDSGGPLFAIQNGMKVQVGITSVVADECETGEPSSFTQISTYEQWIKDGICQLTGVKPKPSYCAAGQPSYCFKGHEWYLSIL